MKKQLFFDDNKLFGRDNVVRQYGKPERIATYSDGIGSTDFCTGYVFKIGDHQYRMLYLAYSKKFQGVKMFAATSEDGIHFAPEQLHDQNEDAMFPHEIMSIPSGWEVANIYEDKHCENDQERYKLLMTEYDGDKLCVVDSLYTSGDLLHWSVKEGVYWANSAEPMASVFYNTKKNVHTIIQRPFWGVRCAGYKETADWVNFTEYRPCLNVDSCDERLAEIYGMYAFEYDGMFIGIPHMYRHLNSELNAKYKNGIIDTQLAYSYNGEYWNRSLREPFISGLSPNEDSANPNYNIVWVSCVRKGEDENIYLYGSASALEHGPAFSQPGTGKIFVHRLRNDGFIGLASENPQEISSVITREKIWHGGELHINLKATNATLAVYISDESKSVGGNVLGMARPLEGFTHDDCIAFSGDSTDWVPEYKSKKQITSLSGKTLVFELRFRDGEVFSLSGDYTDAYNTQAARYRKYGVLPE